LPLLGGLGSESDALTAVIRRLSTARTLDEVMAVTTHAARVLVNADGVTFVLRDGCRCYYADEDAIGPLWKGKRFPISECISGWVMEHGQPAVISDIELDERVPKDAYRATFVKSLAMAPIRQEKPIGAMGAYWATLHTATREELERLQTLANAAALAIAFVERCKAEAALRERASLLDALLENIPEGIVIARGPDVTIERVSARACAWIGKTEDELIGIAAKHQPELWQVLDQAGERLLSSSELPLTRAVRNGETIQNEQLKLSLPDGALLPISCNAGPILDSDGNVTGGIVAWRDVSERAELEEERQLLVRELNHRIKNLFAIVAGMIALTARSSDSVSAMEEALLGRVGALAKAHDVIRPAFSRTLTREETTLQELLSELLSPHGTAARQVELCGPAIIVGPSAANRVALVVHELATNAAKHGALSTTDGSLRLSWGEEDGCLAFEWKEQGGPRPRPPTTSGFGSKLIQVIVKRQLQGKADYIWESSGLLVKLSLPMAALQQ
jgi:PAS domain S-box-containing protein